MTTRTSASSKKTKTISVAERGPVAYAVRNGQSLNNVIDPVSWVTDGKYTGETLKLFDDVGQVYELLLARMEFSTLGHNLELFRDRSGYFEEVSQQKSRHYLLSSVLGKGQIGHSNQYLTHWFYPYKGKFHGQMIKALINFSGADSESLVLDPFLGSGTTLVESATLGIPSVGVEINPALCIVSQIKADCLDIDYPSLKEYVDSADQQEIFLYFHNQEQIREPWRLGFDHLNLNANNLLEEAWIERFSEGHVKELPFKWRNFFFLCYLHALSDYTYLKNTPKAKSIEQFFYRDLEEYLATLDGTYRVLTGLEQTICKPEVTFGSALDLHLSDDSVDAIVTSPPYSIALDYVRNDRHLLDYLGIDTSQLREQMLGLKGGKAQKLGLYEADIRQSLIEMRRVLKPGGIAAILLGDVVVDSMRTNFCYKILSWADDLGFSEAESIRRPILGGYARLRYEYILLLRK